MVDTNGFVLETVVTGAKVSDIEGGKQVLEKCKDKYPNIKLIWVDGAYQGEDFANWVKDNLGWKVEVVKKINEKGFHLLKWRWVVERTFGWFNKWRRLSKDYEFLTSTSESIIYAISLRIMLSRLCRKGLPNLELRKLPQPS